MSVFDAMRRNDLTPIGLDRRAGDPAVIYFNADLAATDMRFKTKHSLDQSIRRLYLVLQTHNLIFEKLVNLQLCT